ncbi:MAG: methionyl-tRNA formyltransferase [Acidobacteriia bacterium]|nr:methionyl-tRNA formyltransferase [Terriglobia bacterium]
MNLIFCGTPHFAVPTLEKLLAEGFTIELVVSQPDEPSGRGYEVKPPPVKLVAQRAGIQVFQPAKLKDPATQEFLSKYHPDAIVVVAYGRIIPPWMIELPRLGCINLHASLLPKYRGAGPIQWAIIRGETVTGVTTMKIDPGMDTGDILLVREIPIREDDTTETLSESLSRIGADLMIETLRGLERGEITPQPQDHSQATMAPMLKKEDGRIDWSLPAREISCRVRGLRPWPGAYSIFRGKNLHIWSAVVADAPPSELSPGTLLGGAGKLSVACGQGTQLEVKEVQLEGRKRLSARDFLNGVHLQPGERLGEF